MTHPRHIHSASNEERWNLFGTLVARLRSAEADGLDLSSPAVIDVWAALGRILQDLGRINDAVMITTEAHALVSRAVGQSNVPRDRMQILTSLRALRQCQVTAGQNEGACESQRQIVGILRLIYDESPQISRDFASDLEVYGDLLLEADRPEAARLVWKESISVQRHHCYDTAYFEGGLPFVNTLRSYALLMLKMGDEDEAYGAAYEALELQRGLVTEGETRPEILVHALRAFARFLVKTQRVDEACAIWEEAISLFRQSKSSSKEVEHDRELTQHLREYRDVLHAAERYEEACVVDEEVVAHFRQLHHQRPTLYSNNLAWSLSSHGDSLAKAAKPEEGCEVLEESVALYRELFTSDQALFGPVLLPILSDYACTLYAVSQREREAPAIAQEAVKIAHWVQWSDNNTNERLINALHRLAGCLAENQEWALAHDASKEVMRLLPHSPIEERLANLLLEVKELEERCCEAVRDQDT